jgi:DNA-binding CsgD family transcriptional regulator/tetratricopeptide (TPR) repeat protein
MTSENSLDRGREAYRLKLWADAFTFLNKADVEKTLKAEDLESLSIAAYLSGRSEASNDIWARAHKTYHKIGNVQGAIRCAFWLGLTLLNKGESAHGGGWIARARRLLDEEKLDCVEQGYLLIPAALQLLRKSDAKGALAIFEKAGNIGSRFSDADLITFGRLGKGQAMIQLKNLANGVTLLDEAMAAVESGEVSPIASGIVYCAVIESCLEIFDIQRAQEWTYALNAWCESQLQLVPFRGQCLIRRSEILQLHGEWSAAIDEAYRASELLVKPLIEPSAGAAFYQLGELYRLQGDFAKADEAYRQASKCGRNPQPGLALLRLFQGQIETAAASIEFMMKETKDRITRSRMLLACVEIMLASRDIQKARIATNELVELASEFNASFLHATAAYAEGAVLLAEGNEQTALEKLRLGKKIWEDMKAPYQAARVRLLIGIACRRIGDEDTAELELEAAKFTFIQVDTLMHDKIRGKTHGLSQRELQVLRLIAIGKSNKDIANDLFISERTVERHVSNIFNKLAVSSRSAATAYAYKRQLI